MDPITLLQGDPDSNLTPLILVHAISGLALPYFAFGPLSETDEDRPVYGISSPLYTSNVAGPLQGTLTQLASHYVSLVRQEIQPYGPYLLGGWSMGGMIAMEMAAILQAQGEEVPHVIMIDSVNPRYFPKFQDRKEHDIQAAMTYNAIAERMNAPEIPLFQCDLFEDDYYSSSGEESNNDSDPEDWPEELSVPEMFNRMRKHIHLGLSMLSSQKSRVDEADFSETEVTLIKCTVLEHRGVLNEKRKTLARRRAQDDSLLWPTHAFKSFNTLPINATHDGCFDSDHADQLTDLLRGVLDNLPY
ncbi:putative secondary metabolism biosynthetic enzyme [Myotisia sp. PD_48]|nr:putative secondary metabolism biosynthetic enzyme [Myotisia sp. PD_48]